MAVSTAGWYIWWVRSHLGVHPAGTRACLQLPYLSSLSDLSRACPPFLPISFSNTNTNTKNKHKQSYLFSWPVKWKFPPKFWLASCLITDFKYCVSVEEFNSILERQTVWRRWKIRNVHWKLKCLRLPGFKMYIEMPHAAAFYVDSTQSHKWRSLTLTTIWNQYQEKRFTKEITWITWFIILQPINTNTFQLSIGLYKN